MTKKSSKKPARSPRPAHSPGAKAGSAAVRFVGTRAAHRDETAEDYAEAIADLIADRGEARVRDLATMMGVSHVTVTRIVSRLAGQGLVVATPYRPIELTQAGRDLAARAKRRHAAVLAFLRALGVGERQAQIDAEGIEHHVSEETIAAMEAVTRRLANDSQGT